MKYVPNGARPSAPAPRPAARAARGLIEGCPRHNGQNITAGKPIKFRNTPTSTKTLRGPAPAPPSSAPRPDGRRIDLRGGSSRRLRQQVSHRRRRPRMTSQWQPQHLLAQTTAPSPRPNRLIGNGVVPTEGHRSGKLELRRLQRDRTPKAYRCNSSHPAAAAARSRKL